ncbi:MAG TPA: UDP-2,3-diacylglucosamine diphosphatase LpxI [bacterium]|nr:UDP-2,3-diacylglucosamine diphosphatase LpxI [bacterium]
MAVGLIAGSGRLPVLLAEGVKSTGRGLVLLSLAGASGELAALADHRYEIGYGDLERILTVLREHRVRELVFAGGVPRIPPTDRADAAFREFLASGSALPGQSLFRRGIELLAGQGILVRGPLDVRPDLATPRGVLTTRGLSAEQQEDIHRGIGIARALAAAEIGQTIAVAHGVVVAVEAAEGTDATIRRAGAHAQGCVIVKVARPDQDMRFDLPAAGPETIAAMRDAGAAVLALEAARTLLLDRGAAVAAADAAGIAIAGVDL